MISRRRPGLRITLLLASLAALSAACGGKVVVESSGATGGGGAGGAPGVTVSVGIGSSAAQSGPGGGPGACSGLEADVNATLAAAQACNPALSVPQCSGTNTAIDTCGCVVVANDSAIDAAQLATMAFKTWASAGCGPFSCFTCPPPPPSPWFCEPVSGTCKPTFQK